jgi:hypothetical protein
MADTPSNLGRAKLTATKTPDESIVGNTNIQVSTQAISSAMLTDSIKPQWHDSTRSESRQIGGQERDSLSTPEQILRQMQAQAVGILAEGIVLSSFKHKGISGIEREEPIRRFLRHHLPGRFHVGQGSIASVETILPHQHDVIIADRDVSFMLLNTISAQLLPIESVHLIVEVRSHLGELDGLAQSLRAVRSLRAAEGIRHISGTQSEPGLTAQPVHTIVLYQGPQPETAIRHMKTVNEAGTAIGQRVPVDFILVLSQESNRTPDSGYLIGYRRDDNAGHVFGHHYYPRANQQGMEGPRTIQSGGKSFPYWYAAILNHLSGVTTYPPNLYSYLGHAITLLPWQEKPC